MEVKVSLQVKADSCRIQACIWMLTCLVKVLNSRNISSVTCTFWLYDLLRLCLHTRCTFKSMCCTPQWPLLLEANRIQRPAPHCWCGLVQTCRQSQCRRHYPAELCASEFLVEGKCMLLIVWFSTFYPCARHLRSAHNQTCCLIGPLRSIKVKQSAAIPVQKVKSC